MPHTPRPIKKTSDQITSVEPTIKMPAWRSDSPKKRNTRSPHTSPTIRPVKRASSPVFSSHSRGVASRSFTSCPPSPPQRGGGHRPVRASLDHQDLRVGREQRLREDVVERAEAEERGDDGLVDGATDALGAARRAHPLV